MPRDDARTDARSECGDSAGDEVTEETVTATATTTTTESPPSKHSDYVGRIRELAAEARAARETFEPPADGTVDERATECARCGVGPVVALYVEARTAARDVAFSAEEHRLLDRALNDWLALYARCYGVELDADFAVREAAEVFVGTHNVRDTARLLTRVPERR